MKATTVWFGFAMASSLLGCMHGDKDGCDGDEGPACAGSGSGSGSGSASAHVLISDQWNNRVIEVDQQGSIVWSFGDGSNVAGPTSVVGPNDVERLKDGRTIIAGSGVPSGTEPGCDPNGCPDNRVLIVDASGSIVWQYGQAGVAGSDADQLDTPVAALMLPSGNVLIVDQGNSRIIEVAMATKQIVWSWGDATLLNGPNSAERLANGNTLIADQNGNRVIEVTPGGAIAWQYPQQLDPSLLNSAGFASRLANGNTLITDSNNARVLEVTPAGSVAWSYVDQRPGGAAMPTPTHAVRLASGDTLITEELNMQVFEVDPTGKVVWSYGQINVAGNGTGQLSWPYDATVVGDFTGLTPSP